VAFSLIYAFSQRVDFAPSLACVFPLAFTPMQMLKLHFFLIVLLLLCSAPANAQWKDNRHQLDAQPLVSPQNSQTPPTNAEPLSQTQSIDVLVVSILLDLLIVRRPFMAWYRRQLLFMRGSNSVDILFKQIGNRLFFEAFIFGLTYFLVFWAATAALHKG